MVLLHLLSSLSLSFTFCMNAVQFLLTEWPLSISVPSLFPLLLLCQTVSLLSVLWLQFGLFPCSSWPTSQNVLEKIQPLTLSAN